MKKSRIRTIGVVTTARADYGLYAPILKRIQSHKTLQLKLYVTGSHLAKSFGLTINDIKKDGFPIAAMVKMNLSDRPVDMARAMSDVTRGFAEVFGKDRPDILLVLGDRYEMHAAALAAIPFGIPVAHIHGGELTYGVFDECFRHSLTKLSHLHFAATAAYARRIVQMGEEPGRVRTVGAAGVEGIMRLRPWPQQRLSKEFGIDFTMPILLVTFHPVTLEVKDTPQHIAQLLRALHDYPNYQIVFTRPNSDMGNRIIDSAIKSFVAKHSNSLYIAAFGHTGYTSLMRYAKVMVGNSSSGIIEATSLHLPVVNIGSRQEGRIRAQNVIDVGYGTEDIRKGLKKALSPSFRSSLRSLRNPYGTGKTSERVVDILSRVDLKSLNRKRFYDFKGKR